MVRFKPATLAEPLFHALQVQYPKWRQSDHIPEFVPFLHNGFLEHGPYDLLRTDGHTLL